jgi:hypothetical protein
MVTGDVLRIQRLMFTAICLSPAQLIVVSHILICHNEVQCIRPQGLHGKSIQ